MKTKDLIRLLYKEDPTGELDVCVENADIFLVEALPAYYDGCQQILIREEDSPYYNVIGAKYVATGTKVNIRTLSIRDAIFENVDLPIEFDGLSENSLERYQKSVEERRADSIKIHNDVETSFFQEYCHKRFTTQFGGDFKKKEIAKAVLQFCKKHLDYRDPMPDDILHSKTKQMINGKEYTVTPSWHERRCRTWDREVEMDFQNGNIILRKVKNEP